MSTIRCLNCDYPLDALKGRRCPECGRPFDPDRPETVNGSGRSLGPVRRKLLAPPGWPMHISAVVGVVAPLWIARTPEGEFDAAIVGGLLWLLIAGAWAGRIGICLLIHRQYGIANRPRRSALISWGVVPIALVTYLWLPSYVGEKLAFQLSRGALRQRAELAIASRRASRQRYRAGLYWVSIDEVSARGAHLFTGYGYDASRCGFAFLPGGPANQGLTFYRSLGGPWYDYQARPRPAALPMPASRPSLGTSSAPPTVAPGDRPAPRNQGKAKGSETEKSF